MCIRDSLLSGVALVAASLAELLHDARHAADRFDLFVEPVPLPIVEVETIVIVSDDEVFRDEAAELLVVRVDRHIKGCLAHFELVHRRLGDLALFCLFLSFLVAQLLGGASLENPRNEFGGGATVAAAPVIRAIRFARERVCGLRLEAGRQHAHQDDRLFMLRAASRIGQLLARPELVLDVG